MPYLLPADSTLLLCSNPERPQQAAGTFDMTAAVKLCLFAVLSPQICLEVTAALQRLRRLYVWFALKWNRWVFGVFNETRRRGSVMGSRDGQTSPTVPRFCCSSPAPVPPCGRLTADAFTDSQNRGLFKFSLSRSMFYYESYKLCDIRGSVNQSNRHKSIKI